MAECLCLCLCLYLVSEVPIEVCRVLNVNGVLL